MKNLKLRIKAWWQQTKIIFHPKTEIKMYTAGWSADKWEEQK